ncbi:hypothetical protein GCM10011374_19810 [Kocuria dechangensis]|uniref:DUF305 domain-containing protein n=1 Tax=Kocuria dechangensis TaxID=1176249 RepID=A0A917LTT7_9MICC|nr:DUF305 domain-containing protein [Kocuria dechangensis]GGG57013.1 hypothetical protein GCM10011374_19810 [Kocuria dechangensis]
MKRSTTLSTLALASALALAGCAAGSGESTGAASEQTTPTAAAGAQTGTAAAGATTGAPSEEPVAAEHDDDDVMFAQMMIPHHAQAVQMSETLLAKDDIPTEVRQFAQKVIDAQGPEIERMNSMLEAWGASATPDDADTGHGGHGSGMMTEEDMAALEEAEGEEAARLYLEQMIEHHRGAIDMAREEVSSGGNPQAVELAQEIVDAQEAEIAEMDGMLQELPDQS